MSSCITLKEAKKKLTCAAYEFAPIMKELLEMWLQAADSLPKHLQPSSTATATDVVQAALQQAPWPVQQHEPRQLAWLQKHLPGISTAMRESLKKQLDISAKRLSILQSLHSKPDYVQPLATVDAERSAHLLLTIMSWGVYLVAPVEVLCTELAPASQIRIKGTRMQQDHDPRHRLQQGNNLISRVGAGLKDRKDMLQSLVSEYQEVANRLKGVFLNDPEEHVNRIRTCQQWERHAGVIWLELLAHLPPKHEGTAHFYHFVDGHCLRKECMGQQLLIRAQEALCRALAQPTLLSNLKTIRQPQQLQREVQQLVCNLQVTLDQLQVAGMPAAQARQLLSKAASDIKPSSSDSTADSSNGKGVGSGQATVEGKAVDAGARYGGPDCDDSGFDVQALLQLMYGCTLQPHKPATGKRKASTELSGQDSAGRRRTT